MILGIDPSSYIELLEKGPVYTVGGEKVDPLSYFHDKNGVTVMRLRIWVDPYDENGAPYLGGTNDLKKTLLLAHMGADRGYDLHLDFHFSDFWVDPAKQFIPKSWRGLSVEDMGKALKRHVLDTLHAFKKEHLPLKSVQIGNEITNGMLWPIAKIDHGSPNEESYDALVKFLQLGREGVKEVYPDAEIMIHLERSFDQEVYREYFDALSKRGFEYDIIGLSYYPYWHHGFDEVFANIDMLQERYHKRIWIVETSYGWCADKSYPNLEGQGPLVIPGQEGLYFPYPVTKEGQKDFVHDLIALSKEHGVEAIVYWEPMWLPLPGIAWASVEGEKYIHETQKPIINEWANQCLFDYDGEATPALFEYNVHF